MRIWSGLGAVYSADGKRILSWSSDKTLRLWDTATGAAIGEPLRQMRMRSRARGLFAGRQTHPFMV